MSTRLSNEVLEKLPTVNIFFLRQIFALYLPLCYRKPKFSWNGNLFTYATVKKKKKKSKILISFSFIEIITLLKHKF